MTNTSRSSSKRNYDELRIDGPPLFRQGSIIDNFQSPKKSCHPSCCPPLDPSTTVLLVVDVQPEYWSECPAVRKDFPNFPSKISSLIENCREQNVKRIIWVRAAYDYDHSPWLHQFARLHQGRIPPVVQASSEWEEFATPLDDEMVITKTSWSSTSGGTGLLDILEKDGIESVLVCGLITSVCVQHSAFGVFEAGYRTILVTDACADRGKERHKAALALYGDYMYELRTVDSLHKELQKYSKEEGVSLCFGADAFCPSNTDGEQKERSLIRKSESDGSLTSATSNADSISTIDEAES
jgi:nicotinamidase-related amidase